MADLAYLNGKILPIEDAYVPIEDRGYQFGDAVYEVISIIKGKLFALEPHLDRLERSMGKLQFPKMDREKIRNAIHALAKEASLEEGVLYLQISRGVAKRDHSFEKNLTPQFVMTIKNKPINASNKWEDGVEVITTHDIRWGRCDIKTTLLLPNSLAKQKAIDGGAYDAILISDDNVVREATSSNVMIVKDGIIHTHPLTNNILPGITRSEILSICKKNNFPYKERFFKTDELYNADEVFLTGTITEVLSVVRVDDKIIGKGKPGPVSKKLNVALKTEVFG